MDRGTQQDTGHGGRKKLDMNEQLAHLLVYFKLLLINGL